MPIVYPHKTAMPCRDPEERRQSWDEVAEGYTVERAIAEAHRCLNCQDPVCEQGCPVNVPIRDFVRHVALGDFAGAARTIRRRNLLPAICGRVCPVEHQCESRCVLVPRQDPVGIGRLERFVADWEREHGNGGETAAPKVWREQKIGDRRLGPGRPHGGQRPRAAWLPRDDLRGATRVRRRTALRHPPVPAAEGDRRRGRRAPQGARRRVRARRDHRQDGHDRPAHRRVRLLGGVRRHRRGLADLHEHPRREPQGHLLGQRVPHARQPDARVLVPRVRHARPDSRSRPR